MEFQFWGPYSSTSCRSFSSSAGLQCPRGQVFASSLDSSIKYCESSSINYTREKSSTAGFMEGEEKKNKRPNRIRKWVGLGLWMGSHFCWFYTTHCAYICIYFSINILILLYIRIFFQPWYYVKSTPVISAFPTFY